MASYTRVLRHFEGLDSQSLLCSENLMRLYPRGGGESEIVTAPGYRRILSLGKRINGVYRYGEVRLGDGEEEILLVHAGDRLYAVTLSSVDIAASLDGLADAPSCGFRFGSYFYLLDRSDYRRVLVGYDGDSLTLSLERVPTYLPTVAVEGEPYEAMSLISESYAERWRILSLEGYGEGSSGLRYSVLDAEGREASLVGGEVSGELRIPSYTLIGGEYYRVVSIAPSAFEGNTEITAVRLGIGIREVGEGAFRACTRLASFSAPGELEVIGYSALAGCSALTSLALGSSLVSIRAYATEGCGMLSELLYSGDDFSRVSVGLLGNDALGAITPTLGAEIPSFEDPILRFPLLYAADEVLSVTLDGEAIGEGEGEAIHYRCERNEEGEVGAILLVTQNPRALYGLELVLTLSGAQRKRRELSALLTRYPAYKGSLSDAVRRCRVGASYDGRIFLGGNPELPGAVFFTSRTASGEISPGYVGLYSYFIDGDFGASLLGLLSAPEGLYVFTDEGRGCGIYLHSGVDTDDGVIPRVYPIADRHVTEGRYLGAASYLDETYLLTTRGLFAISRGSYTGTRLSGRSEGISRLASIPTGSVVGLWLGYLAILCPEGDLYLADGRRMHAMPSGARRPEFWYLSGICGHRNAKRVYRYASRLDEGHLALGCRLAPSEMIGCVSEGTVLAGEGSYYLSQGGVLYALAWEGEESGGETLGFSAALFYEDELIFGDEDGTLYRFATDRRGLPPSVAAPDYDPAALAEFARRNPDYIAPEWYHHDRRAIRSFCLTTLDDCERTGELKSTERPSTLLKVSSPAGFTVVAITDDERRFGEEETAGGELDFSSLRLDAISFASASQPTIFKESTKKWHRKQYLIESRAIGAPLRIGEISYRYASVGKVKRI